MAGLRVFVSSTCYDLSMLRSQLRVFIQSLGYEPIMSDYEDVLYDPRVHTHTSCVDEVGNCDMLIVIIGARFGGKATAEALAKIDFEKMKKDDRKVGQLKEEEYLSVTQLEVLKAIENGMPVYTFIDKKVWHDHSLYEKNKLSEIVDKIVFPSIEKQETAKYIFEFINFVRLRTKGNNIFTFEKGVDIEEILKKQWSSYFQRLLYEQRYMQEEQKRMEILSDQFEDLKTAILSSIENIDQREVARGIVRFRRLFEFLFGLKKIESSYLKTTNDSWGEVLEKANIEKVVDSIVDDSAYSIRQKIFLLCNDGGFYSVRLNGETLDDFASEWKAFTSMNNKTKEIIVETLNEMTRGERSVRYIRRSFEEYTNQRNIKNLQPYEIEFLSYESERE